MFRHQDMVQPTMTHQQAVATDTITILTTLPDLLDMAMILKPLPILQGMLSKYKVAALSQIFRYSRDSGSSSFPSTESTPRTARQLEIDRLSRNLDRNVASILSGDYQRRRDRDDSTLGSSLGSSLNETTSSRRSRFNRSPSPVRNSDGLTAEEAEAAAKKIGWVDEKEAEKRIGTGWWEEQKKKKESPGDTDIASDQPGSSGLKSGSSSLLSRAEKTPKGKPFSVITVLCRNRYRKLTGSRLILN